jgi:class 3 adenylate cyclase/tetratricopeptide (TPR) repeat protein
MVTVLFADIVDSTALAERLDPELLRQIIGRYFDVARTALERHGGTVEKFIGDAVMAVFGIPRAHEDDALRAVRAAVDLREGVRALGAQTSHQHNLGLEARIGVNTGVVVSGNAADGQQLATGEPINVAKKLEQAAPPGEILLGPQTHTLVREAIDAERAEPIALKGRTEPLRPWQLLKLRMPVAGPARSFDAPFVGRKQELSALSEMLDRAERQRTCELCTVIGAAGIGKSRLAHEFIASLDRYHEAAVGHCLSYGEGITYWPLAQIVRQLTDRSGDLGILLRLEDDAALIEARVEAAIGSSESAGSIVETAWAFRRLFETLARRRPLVVVVDDIHWAEPTLLELLEYVVAFSSDAPILLLCLARDDLLATRPEWGTPRPRTNLISLDPLSESHARELAAGLGERWTIPPAECARLVSAAEGNPLFLEQLLLHWKDEGSPSMPPTLNALLAARIDQLEPEEREVVVHAAVEGTHFHRGAMAELLSKDAPTGLDPRLLSLVRKQLIDPDRSWFPGDAGFQFRHILIRDAAYEAAPKELRARVHEIYGTWLEQRIGENATEYEEILGHHLEHAHRYRAELHTPDEHGDELARRASAQLAAAGRRAGVNGDVHAARNLLTRAADLLPKRDPSRLQLLPTLARTLAPLGEYAAEEALLDEARSAAEELGLASIAWHARIGQTIARDRAADITCEEEAKVADRAIEAFAELGDELGLASAWSLRAKAHEGLGQLTAAETAFERSVKYAGDAPSQPFGVFGRAFMLATLPHGPTPVEEGIRTCNEILAEPTRSLFLEIDALESLAALRAMQGQFESARGLIERAKAVFRDLGLELAVAGTAAFYGAQVEMLAGRPDAAESELRFGLKMLEAPESRGSLSTAAALLAHVLCAQGRYDEAEALTRMSEKAAAADDLWSQVPWRTARAKALARRGELDRAEAFATEAIALVEQTELINMHADALLDLSEVLRLSGRIEQAAEAAANAAARYEHKGNVVSARRAHASIRDLEGIQSKPVLGPKPSI